MSKKDRARKTQLEKQSQKDRARKTEPERQSRTGRARKAEPERERARKRESQRRGGGAVQRTCSAAFGACARKRERESWLYFLPTCPQLTTPMRTKYTQK